MKTTLQEYMSATNSPHLLAAKRQLYTQKKKGHIFFKEDIGFLKENDVFEIYYYLISYNNSIQDAIPIPKKSYMWLITQKNPSSHIEPFYEAYYMENVIKETSFEQYDLTQPFIGEEYVWLFQKTC